MRLPPARGTPNPWRDAIYYRGYRGYYFYYVDYYTIFIVDITVIVRYRAWLLQKPRGTTLGTTHGHAIGRSFQLHSSRRNVPREAEFRKH